MKSETLLDYLDLLDEVVTLLDGSIFTILPIPSFLPPSSGALTLTSSLFIISFHVNSMFFGEWIGSFCLFVQHLHKTVVEASRCNHNQNNIYICSFRFNGISLPYNEMKCLRHFPVQGCYYFFLSLSGITVYKSQIMGSHKNVNCYQNDTRRPKYKNFSGQELPPSVSA